MKSLIQATNRVKVFLFFLFIVFSVFAEDSTPVSLTDGSYKVMSFNIRYKNTKDGIFKWNNRRELLVNTIIEQNVDILGVQEAVNSQVRFLKKNLPTYNFVGVGRANGRKRGEFSAIYYNSERFNSIEEGHFWLSETPSKKGSKGWDAAIERVASWVLLEDSFNKDTLFVLNTHFDHEGDIARLESAKLIAQNIDAIVGEDKSYSVLVMGDLNLTSNTSAYAYITDEKQLNRLYDSRNQAKLVEGLKGTFHAFGGRKENLRPRIDYIFTNEAVEVLHYITVGDTPIDGIWLSDHSAILITAKKK